MDIPMLGRYLALALLLFVFYGFADTQKFVLKLSKIKIILTFILFMLLTPFLFFEKFFL